MIEIFYIFLIAIGFSLFIIGGWNIDFAHNAWERWMPYVYQAGQNNEPIPSIPYVGIPWFNGYIRIHPAFWWNLGFFGFMWPALFLVIAGTVGLMSI